MQFHEFAGIYPLLPEAELQELADDIRANGLNDPIVRYEGKVLDGRNRMTACTLAGVKPVYRDFDGDRTAALAFVRSENHHRRHLPKGQLAACHIKYEKIEATLAAEVEKIRDAAESRMKKGKADPCQIFDKGNAATNPDLRTDTARAKMAGTNRQYIHDADTLAAKAPDLLDEVADGKKSMPQAKEELKKRTAPKTAGAAALKAEDKKRAFAAYDKLSKALEDLRVRHKCDAALRTINGVLERV